MIVIVAKVISETDSSDKTEDGVEPEIETWWHKKRYTMDYWFISVILLK